MQDWVGYPDKQTAVTLLFDSWRFEANFYEKKCGDIHISAHYTYIICICKFIEPKINKFNLLELKESLV